MSGFSSVVTELPSALASINDIIARIDDKRLAVFLDYDGTLTPIVDRPELAVLSEDMRATLKRLARVCTTAVISGRALADVKQLIDVAGVFYAGNHGLEIAGPRHTQIKYERGLEYLDVVDNAYDMIQSQVGHIDGILIEHKQFSLSVHYRLVTDSEVAGIEAAIDDVIANEPRLCKQNGKKVFEIRPRIDWDKGKAVLWLLDALALDADKVIPLYIGDDVTDEDAFRALKERGIGIRVMGEPTSSQAHYRLRDPAEVLMFLDALATAAEVTQ
ncbi:MAG: trehalose-phosphatase [Gammaproteobacteria bacterium]|nr:trehalose-phosphatase [Gammaproteobacteria bacterium]